MLHHCRCGQPSASNPDRIAHVVDLFFARLFRLLKRVSLYIAEQGAHSFVQSMCVFLPRPRLNGKLAVERLCPVSLSVLLAFPMKFAVAFQAYCPKELQPKDRTVT